MKKLDIGFLTKIYILFIITNLMGCGNSGNVQLDSLLQDDRNATPRSVLQVDANTRKVIDPKGKDLRIRGIQVPLGFRTTQVAALKPEVVEKISRLGFNMVRVTWSSLSDVDFDNRESVLIKFIQQAIKHQLIVMIELHNFTGKDHSLEQAIDYWVRLYPILKPYESHLMLNIANEWGGNDLPHHVFKDRYFTGLNRLRKAGYRLPVVIDAAAWGQGINYFTQGQLWKQMLEWDKALIQKPNLLFSVHMYGRWAFSRGEGGAAFGLNQDYLDLHLKAPVMIGEVGWNKPGNPDEAKLSVGQLVSFVQKHGVHINIYSWGGNNPRYARPGSSVTADYSYLDFVKADYRWGPNPQGGEAIVVEYCFKNDQLGEFGQQLVKDQKLVISDRKAQF